MNRQSAINIFTHVFFIVLFLIVPTLAFVRPPGESSFAFTRVFVQDTVANFVALCFFYLNYYVLVPQYFFKAKYIQYGLYALVFLSLALMLPHLAGNYLPGVEHTPPPGFPGDAVPSLPPLHGKPPPLATFVFDEFRRHLYLFFTAVFFSFLLQTRQRMMALKEEKLEAELSALRSQINPHFLFNTLNSIYALSVKKDDRATDAIVNLAGLMRYITTDANRYTLPLRNELEYIDNYIELQKARLGNTVQINYSLDGEPGAYTITPLLLISYIENCFKYGVNPDAGEGVIEIRLRLTGNTLQLYTHNSKLQQPSRMMSSGIGMQNTGERMQHLYPGKHQLQINETANDYSLQLEIDLT